MNTSALLRWCDHLFPDYRGEKTVSDSVNSTSLSETIALRETGCLPLYSSTQEIPICTDIFRHKPLLSSRVFRNGAVKTDERTPVARISPTPGGDGRWRINSRWGLGTHHDVRRRCGGFRGDCAFADRLGWSPVAAGGTVDHASGRVWDRIHSPATTTARWDRDCWVRDSVRWSATTVRDGDIVTGSVMQIRELSLLRTKTCPERRLSNICDSFSQDCDSETPQL